MTNYYSILGVESTASAADIKQAYRRLASQHHPDKGGDKAQFQQIQEAYAVLGDQQKRQQYDNPQPDISGIFGFGGQWGDMFTNSRVRRNPDAVVETHIPLDQAHTGTEVLIETHFAKEHVQVPAGVRDGTRIRISGKGYSRYRELPPGDLVVVIVTDPPAGCQRDADHVYQKVTVNALQALTGDLIQFTHFTGKQLQVKIPAGSQPGQKLRMSGGGMPNPQTGMPGDLYIVLHVVVPSISDPQHVEWLNKIKSEVSS